MANNRDAVAAARQGYEAGARADPSAFERFFEGFIHPYGQIHSSGNVTRAEIEAWVSGWDQAMLDRGARRSQKAARERAIVPSGARGDAPQQRMTKVAAATSTSAPSRREERTTVNNPYRTSTATPTSDNPWQLGYEAGRHGKPNLYGSSDPTKVDLFQAGYREGAEVRAATPLRTRFEAAAAATPRQPTRMPSPMAQAFLRGASRAARGEVGLVSASTRELNQAYAAGHRAAAAGDVLVDRRLSGQSAGGWRVRPLVAAPSDIREMARTLDKVPAPADPLRRPW